MHTYFDRFSIIFIILLITADCNSQDTIRIGPVFGTGITYIHENDARDFRIHGHVGLLGNINLNKKFHLQPSILLTNKGFWDPDQRLRLTYLDLTVTTKFFLTNTFFAGIGPQVGWLLSNKYIYLAYGTDYYDTFNIDDALNKFDFGVNSCLCFEFKNRTGLEISLVYGLRDIFNKKSSKRYVSENYNYPVSISSEVKGKNTVVATTFYYLFGK